MWRRLGAHARTALLRGLSAEELRVILNDVARARAASASEADLMAAWRQDPFLDPSSSDPRSVLALQARLWQALPRDFAAVTLSPFAALGSVTRLSGTGQNRVISTMRGNELVYDPLHPLAFEASRRRRLGHPRVHLAASEKVAHAWDAAPGAHHETHFGLVSSAPDGGGLSTEAELLTTHLSFWAEALLPAMPQVSIEVVAWVDPVRELLDGLEALKHERVAWCEDDQRWRHPYSVVAFRVRTQTGAVLGDGGVVQWTQALTGNRKDRAVASGISLDQALKSSAAG